MAIRHDIHHFGWSDNLEPNGRFLGCSHSQKQGLLYRKRAFLDKYNIFPLNSMRKGWGPGKTGYDHAASKHNCSPSPVSKRWKVRKVTTECIGDKDFALRQAYNWVGESLNIFITVVATDIQLPGFKHWLQNLAQEKGRKISVADSDTTAPNCYSTCIPC